MKHYDIEQLIPQRPPVVMIDRITDNNDTGTSSVFLLKADNIFCADNHFLEAGLIENIAQTAAGRMGYIAKNKDGNPLIGYIGAIKNLNVFFCPEVGSVLHTDITVESEIMGFTIISGKVTVKGLIAAQCEMRIFLLKEE